MNTRGRRQTPSKSEPPAPSCTSSTRTRPEERDDSRLEAECGDTFDACGNACRPERWHSAAMPARLVDEQAGASEDRRYLRFDYPRTTPEKALLDWLYLGNSHRSRMTRPPFGVAVEAMNQARLRRLAKRMGIAEQLAAWQAERAQYLADPDVRDNMSSLLGC